MIVRAAPHRANTAAPPTPQERATRVSSGMGMLQAQFPGGTILSALSTNDFEHPWSVYDVEWRTYTLDEDAGPTSGWTLRIKPGFVNGIDPLAFGVYATGGTAAFMGRGRGSALNNVGGAALEFGGGNTQATTATGANPDWYPLLQGPIIPVTGFAFRGGSGLSGRVPPFFRELGVNPETGPGLEINTRTMTIRQNLTADATRGGGGAAPRGLLRRDFFLNTARARFQPSATIIGNLVLGQLVSYDVGFDTTELSRLGNRPRIQQGDFFAMESERAEARSSLAARLASGGPNDDPYDRQFLFSFWLLEPEKKAPLYQDSVNVKDIGPDGPGGPPPAPDYSQWTPYIEYGSGPYAGGWWNFNHAPRNDLPLRFPQLSVDPGLAFLVGRYTFVPQATLGAMEAEQQRILNATLNRTSNEGKFWT